MTGGGRRSGSPLVGRPAGLCQGWPLLLGSPLGPTTFCTLSRDARRTQGSSRDSRGVLGLSSGGVDGRRQVGRAAAAAAATAWWHSGLGSSRRCVEGRQALTKALRHGVCSYRVGCG